MKIVKKRSASAKTAARAPKKAAAKSHKGNGKPVKSLKKAVAPPPVSAPPPLPRGVRRKIGFEFYDPKAKEVFLVGSFNGWEPHATPMKKARDGTWSVDLQLNPGRHEYRILADGHWRDDPNAGSYERNPFGGRNAVLEVRP